VVCLAFCNLRDGYTQEIEGFCSQVAPASVFIDSSHQAPILIDFGQKLDLLAESDFILSNCSKLLAAQQRGISISLP
jgi:hypothetical protein